MKMAKILVVVLLLLSFLVPEMSKAQEPDQELKGGLKQCFDKYLVDWERYAKEAKTTEGDDYTPDDFANLRLQFKGWTQARIDLFNCYASLVVSSPPLLSKVQTEKAKSEAALLGIDSFDFENLIKKKNNIESDIKISANERKVFRLRTFCLDGGRSYPDAGEEFYLAGTTEILGRENLCYILKKAQTGDNIGDIQGDVWGTEKFPKTSASTVSLSPTSNVSESGQKNKSIYIYIGVASIFFLIILIILAIFFSIRLHPGGLKIFVVLLLLILILALLAAIGFSFWQYFKSGSTEKEEAAPAPTLISNESVINKAIKDGRVSIFVISTGSIKETDIVITNNTDNDLEFDVSCLYLLPVQTTAFGEETARFLPFISKVFANPGMGSQKMGTAGSLGEGPPLPDKGPSPEDLMAEITGQIEADLSEALKNFKNNPNEETLKKLLDALGNCQKAGCSQEDSVGGEMVSTWQKFLDEQIKNYKSNDSTENQESLLRATEVCQYLGCDSTEALQILGL